MPRRTRKYLHGALRRSIGLIWLLSACAASAGSPSRSSNVADCANSQIRVADQISACTSLIESNDANVKDLLPDIYLLRGNAHYQNGNLASAISDFSQVINMRPSYANAYQNRGIAEFKRGEYEFALADLNEAIRYDAPRSNQPWICSQSASFYNFRGVILNAMGMYDRAIIDFGKSIEIDRTYVNAYHNRGYAYQRLRRNQEALDEYTKAISLDPGMPKLYVGRASVKMDMDKLGDAILDLNEAIRLDPKDSEAFRVRGEAKRLKNDLPGAMADNDQAVLLSSSDELAYVNRALVFRDKRDYVRAAADLDQAIVINPKSDLAYANRGEVQRLKGDLDQSLRDLDKAVELSPRSPLALSLRGDTLRAKGEVDKAIEDYNAANHFVSDFIPAYVGRGLALESRRDLEGAKAEFEKALDLPSDVDRARSKPAQATARVHLDAVNKAIKAAADEKERKVREENERIAAQKPPEEEPPLPDPGVRVALVIGMSKYEFVPALANPDRDAKGVAETLKAIGFNSVRLVEDENKSGLTKALRDFQDLADNADWALVYYAGHGIEIRGQNYLIPVDAKLATDLDADDEAVSLDRILGRIHNARKLQLVILDACRNNPFQTTMKRADGTRGVDPQRGLVRVEPDTPNELIVYAAKDGEVASDGEIAGHSPFSAALIARLKEPRVEINRVFRNVAKDVYEVTNRTQRPFVYGNSLEDFYFNVK